MCFWRKKRIGMNHYYAWTWLDSWQLDVWKRTWILQDDLSRFNRNRYQLYFCTESPAFSILPRQQNCWIQFLPLYFTLFFPCIVIIIYKSHTEASSLFSFQCHTTSSDVSSISFTISPLVLFLYYMVTIHIDRRILPAKLNYLLFCHKIAACPVGVIGCASVINIFQNNFLSFLSVNFFCLVSFFRDTATFHTFIFLRIDLLVIHVSMENDSNVCIVWIKWCGISRLQTSHHRLSSSIDYGFSVRSVS